MGLGVDVFYAYDESIVSKEETASDLSKVKKGWREGGREGKKEGWKTGREHIFTLLYLHSLKRQIFVTILHAYKRNKLVVTAGLKSLTRLLVPTKQEKNDVLWRRQCGDAGLCTILLGVCKVCLPLLPSLPPSLHSSFSALPPSLSPSVGPPGGRHRRQSVPDSHLSAGLGAREQAHSWHQGEEGGREGGREGLNVGLGSSYSDPPVVPPFLSSSVFQGACELVCQILSHPTHLQDVPIQTQLLTAVSHLSVEMDANNKRMGDAGRKGGREGGKEGGREGGRKY